MLGRGNLTRLVMRRFLIIKKKNMFKVKKDKIELSLLNLVILIFIVAIVGAGAFYGLARFAFRDNLGLEVANLDYVEQGGEKVYQIPETKVVDEESQVIKVVQNASPAVVSIVASTEVPVYERYYENYGGFFGFQVPRYRQEGTEEKQVGAGTGFIVSADGYIVTNRHVVDDEDAKYTVFLNDSESKGEKVEAEVIARDPDNDLAILKIDRDNLRYLEFGDSDNLQIGQTVITIGYALGEFDNTVSKGVISGLSRSIVAGGYNVGTEKIQDLIQTDAAINPGNSGGPMLNINGKVIGVNVAKASAENIGFSLQGNIAKKAFEEARDTGEIAEDEVAYLGVRFVMINDKIQAKNNLDYDYGALIARGETVGDLAVIPGSPADKAGLVENDIILEVDETRVDRETLLSELIQGYQPGDKVTLKVFHRGEEKVVEVELGKN